jgi:hypothetical protein
MSLARQGVIKGRSALTFAAASCGRSPLAPAEGVGDGECEVRTS